MKEREMRHAAFPGVPLLVRTWRFCLQTGLYPWGRPWFLMALRQLCPEEQSLPIKLGSHQPSEQPAHPWGLISQDRKHSSCGEALILDHSNSDWTGALEALCIIKEEAPKTNQDPSYQRPHRVGSRGLLTSLLSQGLGRALCPCRTREDMALPSGRGTSWPRCGRILGKR